MFCYVFSTMKRNKPFSSRTLIETALLCCIGFGMGLIINHTFVSQGLDGSLIAQIKSRLQQQVEEKARDTATPDGDAAIIIIKVAEAKDLCDSAQAFFIDARPPHVFAAGHIQGAINITEQTLDDNLFDLMDRASQTKIVLYCTGPECPEAMELAELIVENDIKPVYVYTGGWLQWQEKGFPVSYGESP